MVADRTPARAEGFEVLDAETGARRSTTLRDGVDLVLLDYKLPDIDGVTVLRKIKEFDQDILVILLTAYASVETAVEAMKIGAYHFANKPFKLDDVIAIVEGARNDAAAPRGAAAARERGASLQPGPNRRHLGTRWRRCAALVAKVAHESRLDGAADRRKRDGQRPRRQGAPLRERSRRSPVHEHHLLGAARGAPRERAVRPRARRVHRRAATRSAACSRSADGGTVFLDEISEMVPALQAKLLRFLEEKAFKRVGGVGRHPRGRARDRRDEPRSSMTKSDRAGSGAIFSIDSTCCRSSLPPLRAHSDDIPALVGFLRRRLQPRVPQEPARRLARRPSSSCRRTAGPATSASCATSSSAQCCSRKASDSSRGISPRSHRRRPRTVFELPAGGVDLEALERSFVVQALKRSGGNQTKAAALLGLNRDQIRYRIEKFGLTVPH